MENSKRPGGSAGAMGGKGFYIVLLLCAAVIGVSAWILLSDVGTNVEEIEAAANIIDVSDAVVTMMPSGTTTGRTAAKPDNSSTVADTATKAEPAEDETEVMAEEEDYEVTPVFSETVTSYVWPVRGGIEVPYSVETLLYDATMADWRTHDGIDVACTIGDQVIAAASGTVVSVSSDDLKGTMVEIDHANGVHSIYANLASEPPVSEGDIVTTGQVIGSVGNTALGETNEVPHLHFAMTLDGRSTDPMNYLPAQPEVG